MPMYEIEHITPLSPFQKDTLAESITQIHSHLFTTPSLFVNVRFTDISAQDLYVAGKRNPTNRILAHVRPGGNRSVSHFNTLCSRVTEAWDRVVKIEGEGEGVGGEKGEKGKGEREKERELRAVFVLGTIVAGWEVGFSLPAAGEDAQWLKDNAVAFRKLAEGGDGDFKDLIGEMEGREDLKGALKEA